MRRSPGSPSQMIAALLRRGAAHVAIDAVHARVQLAADEPLRVRRLSSRARCPTAASIRARRRSAPRTPRDRVPLARRSDRRRRTCAARRHECESGGSEETRFLQQRVDIRIWLRTIGHTRRVLRATYCRLPNDDRTSTELTTTTDGNGGGIDGGARSGGSRAGRRVLPEHHRAAGGRRASTKMRAEHEHEGESRSAARPGQPPPWPIVSSTRVHAGGMSSARARVAADRMARSSAHDESLMESTARSSTPIAPNKAGQQPDQRAVTG